MKRALPAFAHVTRVQKIVDSGTVVVVVDVAIGAAATPVEWTDRMIIVHR